MKSLVNQIIFIVFISSIAVCQSSDSSSAQTPQISQIDKIRISESFNIADKIGDSLWLNWNQTPFAILLVTNDYEFLIRHPNPTDDFILSNYDTLLKSSIYYRPRKYQTHFLASFPAVNALSTVVIGQAENTSQNTSTRWVITMLHEHFHQLQSSQPDYNSSIKDLNLSRGDETGMWMLNYSFPYDSINVKKSFSNLCVKLTDLITFFGKDGFESKVTEYLKEREEFKQKLNSDDYKYFSFQIWQEGIARYTEYALARYGSINYEPTPAFKNLKDYTSLKSDADSTYQNILSVLPNIKLDEMRRIAFYYFGSAEAILLDYINPNWKSQYFKKKFYLEKYFKM